MATDTQERLHAALGERYAIERVLGRGGMATVFLARDIKHDREVAVKVLHPELAASIGGDRFEREIRLAAKLQHPHILGLYDSGEADGLLFYVMPFVQGESLRDRLERESQLPIDDAVQIALEVAGALGHAHEKGIVHRDIKPENVLISGGHALVADFGIARAAHEGGGQKLTQTGMALGTPVYMAPEQAAGEAVGPTADIYSLGCMLYEMLAGEPPFTGKNAMAIMARHAMETVPSVRIVRSSVPEEVEEAIFAAMAKTPADRPQTAAQFAEILGVPLGATATRRVALRHTATRRVPTMASAPAFEPPARPVWKRPAVLAGVAGGLAALGIGAWLMFGRESAAGATIVDDGLAPQRIAVLEFEDLSRDKQLGFLTDGLTDDLIAALSGVPRLSVISRAGVEPFRGASIRPDSIARALGTGTLVSGSVEPVGDKVRVMVRLLEGRSGDRLETQSFEMPANDLLAVRDSIALGAETLIRRRLGDEIRLKQVQAATRNAEAWSLYQRGQQLRRSGEIAAAQGDTATMFREFQAADSVFGLVERLDSRWIAPITARSQTAYLRSRQVRRDPVALGGWIDRGIAIADSALTQNPNDPDALESRGTLRYFRWLMGLEADPTRATALLTAARDDLVASTIRNPVQAGAFATLSHLYYQSGSLSDVQIAARRAYESDAFLANADQILSRLVLVTYDTEQFQDTDRWCQELRRRFADNYNAPRCELYLFTTRLRTPDIGRAWRLADSVAAMAPTQLRELETRKARMFVAAVIARAYAEDPAARAGLADSARRVVTTNLGDPSIDPTRDLAQFGALAYVILRDKAGALDLVKAYLAANERRRVGWVENPPWGFRSIAQDPDFRQLGSAR